MDRADRVDRFPIMESVCAGRDLDSPSDWFL